MIAFTLNVCFPPSHTHTTPRTWTFWHFIFPHKIANFMSTLSFSVIFCIPLVCSRIYILFCSFESYRSSNHRINLICGLSIDIGLVEFCEARFIRRCFSLLLLLFFIWPRTWSHIQCILIFGIYRGRFTVRCMLYVRCVCVRFTKLTLCATHFVHVENRIFSSRSGKYSWTMGHIALCSIPNTTKKHTHIIINVELDMGSHRNHLYQLASIVAIHFPKSNHTIFIQFPFLAIWMKSTMFMLLLTCSSFFICRSVNLVPPMLSIPNQLEAAYQGQDVTLECQTEAYPASINYWTTEKGDMIISGELIPLNINLSEPFSS